MIEKRVSFSYILSAQIMISGILFTILQPAAQAEAEAVLYNIKPATYTQYSLPHRLLYNTGYFNSDVHFRQKSPMYLKNPPMHGDSVFQIEPSDAIDGIKYSQPDIAYDLFNLNSGMKVPLTTYSKHRVTKTSAQDPSPTNFHDHTFSKVYSEENSPSKPMRDIRYLDSESGEEIHLNAAAGVNNYKLESNVEKSKQTHDNNTTNSYTQIKNNYTSANDDLVPVSSDAVLNYEVPSTGYNESILKNSSAKQTFEIVNDVPSLNNSYNYSSTESSKTIENVTQYSTVLNTIVNIDFVNQSNLTEYVTTPSIYPSINEDNATKSLPSTDSEKKLSSGTVAGIVIAVLVTVTLLSSAVIYLLYRRFNGRCTSVVESKFNTDNCGYLDDSLRSSIYLNNHIELPKESSEEMTSLDNDSFLNSLETMTIQNYWADNSKNTKV